jgi:hypothetical protein
MAETDVVQLLFTCLVHFSACVCTTLPGHSLSYPRVLVIMVRHRAITMLIREAFDAIHSTSPLACRINFSSITLLYWAVHRCNLKPLFFSSCSFLKDKRRPSRNRVVVRVVFFAGARMLSRLSQSSLLAWHGQCSLGSLDPPQSSDTFLLASVHSLECPTLWNNFEWHK